MTPIKAIRGMNDVLPKSSGYWQLLEDACRTVANQYGYQEIRFPIVEVTDLFNRTIGQVTDIVEKEMYTFPDRNEKESLSLRPEGTAGCVRACIEHGLLRQTGQRLWYLGPMFRYEKPQKGRYRQFHHFGMEAYGMKGPDIDAEQIFIGQRLWEMLGLTNKIQLQLNSLGTRAVRAHYRNILVDYFEKNHQHLDEDSKRRLTINPLRILDSKNPEMQTLIQNAPKLFDYLDEESLAHFNGLRRLLDQAKIPYEINTRLVRGLDYYSYTVYEWVTESLGAQGTVCGGGRYDDLVTELGGDPTPAVGFALGIERVVLLLEESRHCQYAPDVFGIFIGEAAVEKGLLLAERLRRDLPGFKIETNLTGGNFKNQFKRADRSGARYALILAENELTSDKVSIKNLREDEPQRQFSYDEFISFFKAL